MHLEVKNTAETELGNLHEHKSPFPGFVIPIWISITTNSFKHNKDLMSKLQSRE